MMNVTARYGIMLLCGKLLPVTLSACGFIWATPDTDGLYRLPGAGVPSETVGPGVRVSAGSPVYAMILWLCNGISLCSRVTVGVPPVSPMSYRDSPLPCPQKIGVESSMLGRARV